MPASRQHPSAHPIPGPPAGHLAVFPPHQRLTRNPKLTVAQQANTDAVKRRRWNAAHSGAAPMSEAEAQAKIAEWLARNKPTRCAPATVEGPSHNAGVYWR